MLRILGRAHYLAGVYGLLGSFEKALIINEHASLFIRQATSGLSLEPLHIDEDDLLALPPFTAVGMTKLDNLLTEQKDRLGKNWFLAEQQGEKDDIAGLDSLTLAPTKKQKKGPLVFDITYNYASEVDGELLAARAQGETGVKAKENVQMQEAKKEEELNPTPSKSRFLSWFGR